MKINKYGITKFGTLSENNDGGMIIEGFSFFGLSSTDEIFKAIILYLQSRFMVEIAKQKRKVLTAREIIIFAAGMLFGTLPLLFLVVFNL